MLLFLTGGLQNPFAFLFLGPVLLSATALPPRFTLLLGSFAIACATVLVFAHYPLPWDSDDPLELPSIYMMGVWFSILLAIGFIGVYAGRSPRSASFPTRWPRPSWYWPASSIFRSSMVWRPPPRMNSARRCRPFR